MAKTSAEHDEENCDPPEEVALKKMNDDPAEIEASVSSSL